MVQPKHKRKKKKKTNAPVSTPKADIKAETGGLRPGNKTNIVKYLSVIAGIAAVLAVLYVIFAPKLSTGFKKNRLKDLNVIFISLDTLRADFVSAYGDRMAQTPNMDRVAREGVLFETCISQTPLTLPAHTTMLSGTYPLYHQVRDNGGFLVPQSLEFVSEILKEKGFSTSAFIASYVLNSKWGINQGFDHYSDDFDLSKYERFSLGSVQKRADEVLADARKWLIDHKNEKFFTWIHLYDPHTPYDPPSPFKEKYPKRPYRGEVEYMDHQLGLFFDFLKKEGLYSNSLIILAGDHGEALGQHGERTHGFFIYEPTARVPFIIRAPFGFPVSRVTAVVELVDIAPTILDALGFPIPESYQGQSLVALMFGSPKRQREAAYAETYYPRLHFGWSELKALYYDNNWKYILAPKEELYDLQADEKESENMALKKSYQARQAKQRIQRFIRIYSQGAKTPGDVKHLDKDDMQKLAALGYLTTTVDTSNKVNLPDPKGKVGVFNNLSRAKQYMAEEKYDTAIELLQEILDGDPHLVDGILQLGNAYSRVKKLEEALKCYYDVLDIKPDYNAAMINVINTHIKLRWFDKGIEEAKRFLKTFPNDHSLYNELATLYFLKEQYDEAMETLQTSIRFESVNPHAFNKIGGILIIRKEYARAKEYLDRAFKINPNLRKLNFHLAQVQEGYGSSDKAIEYYKKELDHYPGDFRSAYNLAEELRKKGRFQDMLKYYRMSIDSNPKFNIPYFMIAKYYLDRRENIEQAVELCKTGVGIEPPDKYTAFGYYILSDISSLQGKQEEYRGYLSRAEKLKRDLTAKGQW